jgi:exopolysaccharide/PEP-CTERM locus tyrosine autokinase
MSLIERAVTRLQPGKPGAAKPVVPGVPEGAGPGVVVPLAAGPRAEPRLSAIDPPAAPTQPAAAGTDADGGALAVRRPTARIKLDALRKRGFSIPGAEPTPQGDAFRLIKRPLLACASGRGAVKVEHGRRIMVTSSLPGEGKTFCAINLAMSIAAERDHSVMLIDADVVRPSAMKALGVSAERGLMDWLLGDVADVHELVIGTNVRRLTLLPAGRRHELATELLASGKMERMLDALSQAYPNRILMFDAPPLLAATEAQALAAHMGQIVLVVEAGRTLRGTVEESLSLLKSGQNVNLLLNKARGHVGTAQYGYRAGGDGQR